MVRLALAVLLVLVSAVAAQAQVISGQGLRTLTVYDEFVSGTIVCNTTIAGTDSLYTIPALPANTLARNAQSVFIVVDWSAAATANAKNWGITVGGTNVTNTGSVSFNNAVGKMEITIRRVDATHVNVNLAGTGCAGVPGCSGLNMGNHSLNLAVSDLTANTLALLITGKDATAANGACITGVTTLIPSS